MNSLTAVLLLFGFLLSSLTGWMLEALQKAISSLVASLTAVAAFILGLIWMASAYGAKFLGLGWLRRYFISRPLMEWYKRNLPPVSDTERAALQSGDVWWEGELFAGKPDWSKLRALPPATLSEDELRFIEGPCEKLCQRLDEWKITHEWADLPPDVWDSLKHEGFFSMIIPKKYGGLGFSNYGHAQALLKVASHSPTAAAIMAVPNSLGPAELIYHYGTEEQKEYYLPRLADGTEVPCFALTSPVAGSDATSIVDTGYICEGWWGNKQVLGLRLNWDKRYITLAPVATILGLAFKLYDPQKLIGDKTDLGITCALIPTYLPGVTIGKRHFPLNIPFQNGPTSGKDVFVPLDAIIGGIEMAGQGWRMLVETLSVGRSISLPTNATGAALNALKMTGAYARIREQFGISIAEFEGIQEPLARMAADCYTMKAVRRMTLAALDHGEKPAIASAIVKYHVTELGRRVANNAMDIHGGKGIILGPKNYLARSWQSVPIAITVEGANILTRSLMIFGQGAIRAHPYVLAEMDSANNGDLTAFDKAIFGHIGFVLRNMARTAILAISGGFIGAHAIPKDTKLRRRYRALSRYSAAFATVADSAMLIMGGTLKRRERLSARLGDLLSYLYMGSAILKCYGEDGEPTDDRDVVDYALDELEKGFVSTLEDVLSNFSSTGVSRLLNWLLFPHGRARLFESHKIGSRVAQMISNPTEARERLVSGVYAGDRGDIGFILDEALRLSPQIYDCEKRIKKASRAGQIPDDFPLYDKATIKAASDRGIISADEAHRILYYYGLVEEIVSVDDFTTEELAIKPIPGNENESMELWRRQNLAKTLEASAATRHSTESGDKLEG